MKITKILRVLLIALSIMTVFALFACDNNENETSDTSESVSESVSESNSESDSGSESETEKVKCKHANTTLDDKCDKICSDCGATVATAQHKAGDPDANDECNVKCVNCGKVMKKNQHTEGKPDANDNCNVTCTVCKKVVKTAKHTRPTAKDENCNFNCAVCSAWMSTSHGDTSSTWNAVDGVAADGKLYEIKTCVDCGIERDRREVAKTGTIDSVKIGITSAASSKGVGQTITLEDGKNSGDVVVIAGWVAINGGVEKYVYRITVDDTTTAWIDAIGEPQNMDATAHKNQITAIKNAKLDLAGYETKGIFTGGIKTGDLFADYNGKTITVEFAAVPANNKGTDEAPNTIVIAKIENIKVACSHSGNTNEYKVTAADPQWFVCESCSICGEKNLEKLVSDETPAGLHMFGPSYIASKKGTLMTGNNGFSYVRIVPKNAQNEESIHLFSDAKQPIENVGGYLAIIYRSTVSDFMDFYIDSNSTTVSKNSRTGTLAATGDKWSLVVQDISSVSTFDGEKLVALRFDYVNDSKNRTEEDYVDVACIAFFATKEEAAAYYAAYVTAYLGAEGCGHPSTDGVWVGVEGQVGKIAQTCNVCHGLANITDCAHKDSEKLTVTDRTHPIFDTVTCALCGVEGAKVVSTENQTEKHVFTPEYISGKKGTLMAGTNGMEFVRIKSANPAGAEEFFNLYMNAEAPLKNVGQYIAILYRSSVENKLEFFLDHASTTVQKSVSSVTLAASEQWQLVIIDTNALAGNRYNGEQLAALRFDYFNNGANKRTANDYVDVAFISFFANEADAYEYYLAYLEEYIGKENCKHEYDGDWTYDADKGKFTNTCLICAAVVEKDCKHTEFSGEWTPVEGETGKTQNTCATCNKTVTKECTDHTFTTAWTATENEGEIKNTCASCGTEIVKVCDHKNVNYTATSDPFTFNAACADCKKDLGTVSGSNSDGKSMLDANAILNAHGITSDLSNLKEFTSKIEKTEGENGMNFVRFEAIKDFSGERYLYFTNAYSKSISGTGTKFVIMYRASKGVVANWDLFVSNSTGLGADNKTAKTIVVDGEWHLVIFDMPAAFDANKNAGAIRLDMFDGDTEAGAYVDIAYAGFFGSDESAKSFYGAYLKLYGLCQHTEFSGDWTPVEGQIGQTQNTCAICGDTVTKICDDHGFSGDWTAAENVGEIKNTCALCGTVITKTCDHSDASKLEKTDAEHDIYDIYNCTLCGVKDIKVVSAENQAGKHVFTPEYISNKKGTLITDANGMTYVRIMSTNPSATEENMWLYKDAEAPLTGVGQYLAILFRSSVNNQFEMFVDSKTTDIKKNLWSSSFTAGEQWQLMIIDLKIDGTYYDGEQLVALRFDYFNNGANNRTEDDYVDIAFMSFFASKEEAHKYYGAYVAEYIGAEGCGHYANDGEWVGTDEIGKIGNTCIFCNTIVNITDCHHTDDEKIEKTEIDHPIFSHTAKCTLCGVEGIEIVSTENQTGKYVFTPEYISGKKGTLKTEENGFSYVRIMSAKPSAAEENFYLIGSADTPVTNAGRYIAVLYRSSVDNQFEFFLDHASGATVTNSVSSGHLYKGEKWQFVIIDTNALANNRYSGPELGMFRFDYFNNGANKRTAEDYVDVAFISFFEDKDAATAYYVAYLHEFGFCDHTYADDSQWTPVEGETGKLQNICTTCGETVKTDCGHTYAEDSQWTPVEGETGKLQNICTTCGETVKTDCTEHTYAEDSQWTPVEGEAGKIQNTCTTCGETVKKDCEHTYAEDSQWTPVEGEAGKIQNTCTTCGETVKKDCEHETYTGNWKLDVESGKLTKICAICGHVAELANDKHMFNALDIFKAHNITVDIPTKQYISAEMMSDGTMDFVRFKVIQQFNNEKYLYFTNASAKPITKVGEFFAIMYRASEGNTSFDCYINDGTGAGKKADRLIDVAFDEEWRLVIFKVNKDFKPETMKAGNIRFDIFNDGKHPEGTYVDIAFAGFFNESDTANEFYKAYLRHYNVCNHAYAEGSKWTGVDGQPGKVQNTCTICDGVVIEDCHGHSFSNAWTPVEGEIGYSKNTCDICAEEVKRECEEHDYPVSGWKYTGNGIEIIKTCVKCNHQVTEDCGHSYGEWTPDEDENGKTGKITHTCGVCKHEETINCIHPDLEADKWEPVEGQTGMTQQICSHCEVNYVIECSDHNLPDDSWTPIAGEGKLQNTCTKCATVVPKDCEHDGDYENEEWTRVDGQPGKVQNICKICESVVIEACRGHKFEGEWIGVEGQPGKVQNTCTICDEKVIEDCHGHNYLDNWTRVEGQPGKLQDICTKCGYADVKDCDHAGNTNSFAHDTTDPQNDVCAECSVCGAQNIKKPATTTPNGKIYFGAEYFASKKGNLKTEENGFKYVRITDNKTSGEGNFTLYNGTADNYITNGAKYVAILVRKNVLVGDYIDVFFNSTTGTPTENGKVRTSSITAGDTQWKLFVVAIPTSGVYDGSNIMSIRFDFYNHAEVAGTTYRDENSYVDVAYMALYDTEAEAKAHYIDFVKAYLDEDNCMHYSYTDEMVPTDDPLTFNVACEACGAKKAVSNINAEGNHMYDADSILAGSSTITSASKFAIEKRSDGEFEYVHFEVTEELKGEAYFNLTKGGSISNIGNVFVVMYRTDNNDEEIDAYLQVSGGSLGRWTLTSSVETDEGWHILVYEAPEGVDTTKAATNVRFDIFESGRGADKSTFTHAKGDYVDIAFAGFFDTTESADAVYNACLEYYGLNAAE